ncbi:MAG: hypothetical protein WC384_07645 [Prolixibacteraceae bacterium]|jgi:uncharacterized protein YjaZ
MFLSFSTYRRFLVITLTMLVAIPCFAKKEMKQWLNIETNQQAKPIQQTIACYTICQLEKQDKKEKVAKHILPSPISDSKPEYFAFAKTIQLPDFYNSRKQKIPSYLLFERFLI